MTPYNFYNENDEFAAEWLRNLIEARLIPDGYVDTRSIVDIAPRELVNYTQCHFFAGIGGWPLALRLSGWPDHIPVWTGSCPCQPFSVAGKRAGFDDPRHLWPYWRYLIEICQPPILFGEQVASASDWLRLVRGDLEAMGFAVGAIPFEAASAGADHLRDRYGFVAHDTRERRGEGRPEHEVRSGRDASAEHGSLGHAAGIGGRAGLCQGVSIEHGNGTPGASGVGLADAYDAGPQGRIVLPERAGERLAGPDGVADADSDAIRLEPGRGDGPDGSSARLDRHDSEAIDLADPEVITDPRQRLRKERGHDHADIERGDGSSELSWVIGADGKARRVKPGVRLLVDGFPNRVGLLRGFGNAIDPRAFAQFITASVEALTDMKKAVAL